jgi:Ca2+-binding EF-hand superfamily protein
MGGKAAVIQEENNDEDSVQDNNRTELTKLEVELCRQNFQFYDKQRQGYVERFELPMLLNGKSGN